MTECLFIFSDFALFHKVRNQYWFNISLMQSNHLKRRCLNIFSIFIKHFKEEKRTKSRSQIFYCQLRLMDNFNYFLSFFCNILEGSFLLSLLIQTKLSKVRFNLVKQMLLDHNVLSRRSILS